MPATFFSARNIFLAAAAIGLTAGFTAPTKAQDYRNISYGSTEQVIVTAPRLAEARGSFGAPIRDVALTTEIRFDDLDLTTRAGARVLKHRVSDAARDLCRRLEVRFPVATPDSPPCFQTAYNDAMEQADEAIEQARSQE